MTFAPEQIDALRAKLDGSIVKQRDQAGRKLSYIEGWHAIAEANRIFGFDAWDRETVELRLVSEKPRKIGKGQYEKDGFGVSYIAKVRVVVRAGQHIVLRDGTGYGSGIDADLGAAHESAIKEAETDAMKRALMTFGNPFGLALYDKEQNDVERPTNGNGHSHSPKANGHPAPAAGQAKADMAPVNPDVGMKDLVYAIKDEIDTADRLAELNTGMTRRGEDYTSSEPKPDSDLARVRAFSETAYRFLIDRANKRRSALANQPQKQVA